MTNGNTDVVDLSNNENNEVESTVIRQQDVEEVISGNTYDELKAKNTPIDYLVLSRCLYHYVLILGVQYDRGLFNQTTNGVGLTELVHCLDLNNDLITDTIARDTIRAACITFTDLSLVVHTLTKHINVNNPNTLTETYSNINKSTFINDMETKKWFFEKYT